MTAATIARPRAKAAPRGYQRPTQEYLPNTGATVEERIGTLRAALYEADQKLEDAYDAAERGSAVETLLDLVNHDLLCEAMHPLTRNDDPDDLRLTKADVKEAHSKLFPVLAVLEGAMSLAIGQVIYPTIVEAFQLIDWAQDECDAATLGAQLPLANVHLGATSPFPPAEPPDSTDADDSHPLDDATAHYAHALQVVRLLCHDQQHSTLVRAACNLMIHDYDALCESLGRGVDALNNASADLSVVIPLLAACAHDLSDGEDSAMWGALTLATLSKEALDKHIGAVEFPGRSA